MYWCCLVDAVERSLCTFRPVASNTTCCVAGSRAVSGLVVGTLVLLRGSAMVGMGWVLEGTKALRSGRGWAIVSVGESECWCDLQKPGTGISAAFQGPGLLRVSITFERVSITFEFALHTFLVQSWPAVCSQVKSVCATLVVGMNAHSVVRVGLCHGVCCYRLSFACAACCLTWQGHPSGCDLVGQWLLICKCLHTGSTTAHVVVGSMHTWVPCAAACLRMCASTCTQSVTAW